LHNNALNRAKILLDSINVINTFPEYYNLYGNYLMVAKALPENEGKDYFNDIIIEYYRLAVRTNEIALSKEKDATKTAYLKKNKARYLNNWGWAIIKLKAKHRYTEAREIFIDSIHLSSYKDFSYPYYGILIIEKLIQQPGYSSLPTFMHKILAFYKVNKEEREMAIKTVKTQFSSYLNSRNIPLNKGWKNKNKA
jgi:hypothetical protein